LRISHFTARDHVSALLRKSGVRRREELSAFARVGKRVLE
jgi:DNA-binding CsgD family transcriptional regulator